jgi:hypothetical protein
MKRFILSLASAAVLFGAMSSPLLAAPHGVHPVHYAPGFHGLHYGPGGYLTREYRGWTSNYWDARYRCQFYFHPEARCYYYWYAPGACYLPMSQIAIYPPTVTVVNNVVVTPGAPMPMPY